METIIFKTRDELFKVNMEKLVYAMADDNYVHLYFHNKQSIMICMTLQTLEKMILNMSLKNDKLMFIRIGRKYIINHQYIAQINILKQQLVLSDWDTMSPIILNASKEALKTLKQTITAK